MSLIFLLLRNSHTHQIIQPTIYVLIPTASMNTNLISKRLLRLRRFDAVFQFRPWKDPAAHHR